MASRSIREQPAAAHGVASIPPEAPQPFAMKPSPASGGAAAEPPAEGALASSDARLADEALRAAPAKGYARAPAPAAARRPVAGPTSPATGALGGAIARPTSRSAVAQAEAADLSSDSAGHAGFATPPRRQAPTTRSARPRSSTAMATTRAPSAPSTGSPRRRCRARLWAARSAREGAGGCSVAAARFDQVAAATWGSTSGYDATLEGAQCYARLGQAEAARSRYERLLTVPSYAARAQAGIKAMSLVAAKARQAPPRPAAVAPAVDATTTPPAAAAPAAPSGGP